MFNKLETIMFVDDRGLEKVIKATIESTHVTTSGDGKIFVSNVEEIFDIVTKQSGKHAL